MRRKISHVLVWGAAFGLLLASFAPVLAGLSGWDAPAAQGGKARPGVPASSAAADRDGVVTAQPSGGPALMHRKLQGDGGADSLVVRPNQAGTDVVASAPSGGLHSRLLSGSSPRDPERNTPLRL